MNMTNTTGMSHLKDTNASGMDGGTKCSGVWGIFREEKQYHGDCIEYRLPWM